MTEVKVVKRTKAVMKIGGQKIPVVRLEKTDGIIIKESLEKSEVEIILEERKKGEK